MKAQCIILIICVTWCSAQFIDDMQEMFDLPCLEDDMFLCMDGGCIEQAQYCDGISHCDDNSDESMCLFSQNDIVACNVTHQFECRDNKRCIPRAWICNNETDCDDGSDEVNCTVTLPEITNSTCKGFKCLDGKCISYLWLCDGVYDCNDRSDENAEELCRHLRYPHAIRDGSYCHELPAVGERNYKCLDSSYCLPSFLMCDGTKDCRDGSDEGPFCENWTTMCSNYICAGNDTECSPDRYGPTCLCVPSLSMRQYNYVTKQCDDVNECLLERPHCSHTCVNADGHYTCECDPGYTKDEFGYLCYANGPEAMLFFSTRNDIRYLKIKSKQMVTVATNIKQAHGVSFDGTYIYWVETAEGHQSIFKAQLDDVKDTKQVLVGLGLEDPGDIAVDYLGGNIYFSDAERGIISACRVDGSICTTIKTDTKHPKFVTLDVRNGKMYWADWNRRAVIMSARMDGSHPDVLVDNMDVFATGLAIDAPNGRLYYVDKTVKVVMLNGKHVYKLFDEPFHYPYSIAVFENTVFWSDWTTNTIQTTDKLHGSAQKRNVLLSLDTAPIGMHMYQPVLMNTSMSPCSNNNCSHLCLVTSNTTHVCACPDGMEIMYNTCHHIGNYRAKYLVVGGGELFSRLQYDALGNPECHATHFDIGRVQAMAYDNYRDSLFIFDGQRKTINYINMTDFTLGITHLLAYNNLEDVVDMDYDYATDSLYVLDAGRHVLEVISLRTQKRALVHRFRDLETPISFCVMPDYGKLMVAVVESDFNHNVHIDSIGLDGEGRRHVVMNNLKGPHIRLRYVQHMDVVFLSDESNFVIDYIHPEGTGRESHKKLSTTVTSLAIADNYVFWTDRRTPRLFWSDIHETSQKIRRIELALFPNNTQLLLQATTGLPDPKDPLLNHPCLKNPCSDVCVQKPRRNPHEMTGYEMGYKCLCPPGLLVKNGQCVALADCEADEVLCHRSNVCVKRNQKCDGKVDCPDGEDEEGCIMEPAKLCLPDEIYCDGLCVSNNEASSCSSIPTEKHPSTSVSNCSSTEFACSSSSICLSRSQLCDGRRDCPDGADEQASKCDTLSCFDTEFMCASGSCIPKTWKCDGDEDCNDGSDEVNCVNMTCRPGFYQCRDRECIELRKRCDGHQDCFDYSDEEDCEDPSQDETPSYIPSCAPWEYSCERNSSICLPPTARCNMKVDCPGSTDEHGCDFRCAPHGLFACSQQLNCLTMDKVCNGHPECVDGSDETPEACGRVNKTSHLFPTTLVYTDCIDGYRCNNGHCIEWEQLCDGTNNCFDGSDENGLCPTACENNTCSFSCQPTPLGPQCSCPIGFRLEADQTTCVDIDECKSEVCSQVCINFLGSFLCSCHHGYALRSDRRSCKALRGNMSVLYVSGNTVRSVSADGYGAVEFTDKDVATITDMDFNVRSNKLYVTSTEAGKLLEVNSTRNVITVTNVGRPSRVAVDWVTGNVYFIDSTPSDSRVRVCHVKRKRCASLQPLPSDAKVTALIVEPSSRRMFYCVTRELESVVWSASLAGGHVTHLTTVHNCTGLAVDPFKKKLYVAETGPAHIIEMDYEGESHKKILADHPQLQAPHGLAIFEDHIYYLVANSFRLSRCLLFGPKHCETYIYRVFDANTFVIRHESVQRDDLEDGCKDVVCGNVCAMDEDGPKCLCDDGALAKDGMCPVLDKKFLPLFNGWSYEELASAHSVSFTVITAVMVLVVIYLCVFVYYHFVYKPRKNRASAYTEVRFQNTSLDSSPYHNNTTVTLTTESGLSHEFVNPLQYVRNMFYGSFRRQGGKPNFTDGATFTIPISPPQQDLSDTESDLDDKEHKRILRNK
ncbi:vitellogenin receptor-like [Trichoplusia ni]|uniref:Vitellogenin receptor-like n=1 Tax=Trichoplusia ni TaxID=7111 RepID=A0A7E5VJH1_TRINI|nr:vitellogenin receptor-like [Trichoplusia ni]